jgi:hypothetical protein
MRRSHESIDKTSGSLAVCNGFDSIFIENVAISAGVANAGDALRPRRKLPNLLLILKNSAAFSSMAFVIMSGKVVSLSTIDISSSPLGFTFGSLD